MVVITGGDSVMNDEVDEDEEGEEDGEEKMDSLILSSVEGDLRFLF